MGKPINSMRGHRNLKIGALWGLGIPVWLGWVPLACTDVELLPAKRTVELTGEYRTSSSSLYDVPIRILLIIDTSKSMEENDPTGHRAKAAADLISTLSGKGQDIAFGFIGFNTAATQITQGFETDPQVLSSVLNNLNQQEGFTNYLDALAVAKAMIDEDLSHFIEKISEAEKQGKDARYLRPWYFVVFLSDGIPRMPGGENQSTESILFEVEQLMDLPEEALGITLHTAFLGAKDDQARPEAEALLRQMAKEGQGKYYSFEKGDEIDFTVFEFKVKRLFDIKQFLIWNRNAVLFDNFIYPDSDGDGSADFEEESVGTNPLLPDTDEDGLGDGFELRAALDPLKVDYRCGTDSQLDTDNDGLNDCEESFLNFDKERFDTDGDLFPDGFEFYSGSNPGDGSDIFEDLDFDGVPTNEEIRQRTDPRIDDREYHPYYAYRFDMKPSFEPDRGIYVYDFDVQNVSLARTQATEQHAINLNELVIYFIESPEDDAEHIFTLFRMKLTVPYQKSRKLNVDDPVFVPVATQETEKN